MTPAPNVLLKNDADIKAAFNKDAGLIKARGRRSKTIAMGTEYSDKVFAISL